MTRDYLRTHVVVETADLDQARAGARVAAIDARYTALNARFSFRLSISNLKRIGLVYYRCSPMAVRGQIIGAYYSLLMHEDGHGDRCFNAQKVMTSSKTSALMSSVHDEVRYHVSSSRGFNLRFDKPFLDDACQRRFPGAPPLAQWPRQIATDRGAGAALASLVRWLADALDDPASEFARYPRAVDHLEKAARSLLLEALAPVCPRQPSVDNGLAPRAVRRVEDWIEAHFAEPIALEDLAAVAGCGVRGLQRAFRRHRDRSPLAALTQRRLEAARALLSDPGAATTVTTVALDVGFCHTGRFAARYRATFGELPKTTLARARAR